MLALYSTQAFHTIYLPETCA